MLERDDGDRPLPRWGTGADRQTVAGGRPSRLDGSPIPRQDVPDAVARGVHQGVPQQPPAPEAAPLLAQPGIVPRRGSNRD